MHNKIGHDRRHPKINILADFKFASSNSTYNYSCYAYDSAQTSESIFSSGTTQNGFWNVESNFKRTTSNEHLTLGIDKQFEYHYGIRIS